MMIAINMEMPESCVECRFGQGDYGFCHAMPENFCGYVYEDENKGKPNWCPLYNVQKLMAEIIIPNADKKFLGNQASAYAKRENVNGIMQALDSEQARFIRTQDMPVDDPNIYKRVRSTICIVENKEKQNDR